MRIWKAIFSVLTIIFGSLGLINIVSTDITLPIMFATGKMLICVNPQWFRPTDVDNLWGDPTKAKTVLGWNPQSTTYEQLVEIMAKHDRERAKREKALKAVL